MPAGPRWARGAVVFVDLLGGSCLMQTRARRGLIATCSFSWDRLRGLYGRGIAEASHERRYSSFGARIRR
jgi:hypothetical protein